MSLVPNAIQDETTLALEECVKEAIEKIDFSQFIVAIPELAPEKVLAFIAQERHVLGKEGWNGCATKEDKLALLGSAFELHRKKGTVGAIEKCLKISNVEAKLLRWFEYEGVPHHYKIVFNLINKSLSAQVLKQIYEKVEEYKQLRAKQDGFEINCTMQGAMKITPVLRNEVIKLTLPLKGYIDG